MRSSEKHKKDGPQLILFAFLIIFIFVALYFSISVFLISLIGIGLGVLVAPVLSVLQSKYSIPRLLGAFIVLLSLSLSSALVFYSIWYLVFDQIERLALSSPDLAASLNQKMNSFLKKYPIIEQQFDGLNIKETAKEFTVQMFMGLQMGAQAVTGIVFAFVIGLYSAISLPQYFESSIKLFPASNREKAQEIMIKCAQSLRVWFKAQASDMAILGIITSLSLWAIGVDYWAVFGLLTSILTILPYIGILFVVTFAVLVTLASEPSMVPWVIIIFAVTQQLEANLILPLIMKSQVNLPEVPLLIFILFFGVWFGLLGIFIAPPIFTVLRVLYLEFYQPHMDDL